jgi:hypothetical protein
MSGELNFDHLKPDEKLSNRAALDYVDFSQLRAGWIYSFTTSDFQPKSGEVIPGGTVERVFIRQMISEGARYLEVAPISAGRKYGGRELIHCDTVEAIQRMALSIVKR